MGQSFLNNKKRVKERIQEEIASIQSSTAMEFKLVKAQLEAAKEAPKEASPERLISPYLEDQGRALTAETQATSHQRRRFI